MDTPQVVVPGYTVSVGYGLQTRRKCRHDTSHCLVFRPDATMDCLICFSHLSVCAECGVLRAVSTLRRNHFLCGKCLNEAKHAEEVYSSSDESTMSEEDMEVAPAESALRVDEKGDVPDFMRDTSRQEPDFDQKYEDDDTSSISATRSSPVPSEGEPPAVSHFKRRRIITDEEADDIGSSERERDL